MSFDPITAAIDAAKLVIDKIFPDPAQRDAAKLAMYQAQQAGEFKPIEIEFQLAIEQIKVNAVEASSSSLFVSGGRPAAMWVCVSGLAYTFLLQPLLTWGSSIGKFPAPPPIDTTLLLQLLFGMLGLGALRTAEKFKGVASK